MSIYRNAPLMTIGILGGIGPESTSEVYREFIFQYQTLCRPESNAEYPHIIVNSIPAKDLIGLSDIDDEVLKDYNNGIRELEQWGADAIFIACNSAFNFYKNLIRDVSIPVISVRDVIERTLKNKKIEKIIALASPTTIRNGLYSFDFVEHLSLSHQEVERLGHVITKYNLGKTTLPEEQFVVSLAHRGAEHGACIIGGCTEITSILRKHGVRHLDPMVEMISDVVLIWQKTRYLQKADSHIHGTGIFVRKQFHSGEVLYRTNVFRKYNHFKDSCAYIDGSWCSDPSVLNFVNHSCFPNARIVMDDRGLLLVALRDILPNDELVCDYDVTEGFDGESASCFCHQKTCRHEFHIKK